ncbi:hypothetical protein HZS_5057, partial [Henneguya salminicola]
MMMLTYYYRTKCNKIKTKKIRDNNILVRINRNSKINIKWSIFHPKFVEENNCNIPKRCIKQREVNINLPWIVGITPTYTRMTQIADLIRLGQSLEHIENFVWILIEDSENKTISVKKVLNNLCLMYLHLNILTPSNLRKSTRKWFKPHRGVEQRNLGLNWLRNISNHDLKKAVIYFMDDDNTYSVNLFEKIRNVEDVSVWPVGHTGGCRWSGPLCDINDNFLKFHANWGLSRKFPVDMAGFGVSLKLIIEKKNVIFRQKTRYGYLENQFIIDLLSNNNVTVPKGICGHIYVWHTRTETPKKAINGELALIKANK